MRPSTSFGIRTIIIVAISVGLGLAFNTNRTAPLPLISAGENIKATPRVEPPAQPEQAAEPAQPVQSEQPSQQEQPAEQEQQAQPGQPSEQEQPAQQEQQVPEATAQVQGATSASDALPQPTIHGEEISLQDASVLFASKQAVFVDARDADSYAQGHIQGALSLPLYSFTEEFPAVHDQLTGKTVITYCDGEHCQLSREVADQLKAAGLQGVLVLKNGWTLWQEAGLPTATGSETPEGGRQ